MYCLWDMLCNALVIRGMEWFERNKPALIILLLATSLIGGGVLMLKENNKEPQTLTVKDSGNNLALNNAQPTAEVAGEQTTSSLQKSSQTKSGLININTADQSELEELEGIGPTLAQRIIIYRETNGPFSSIEELKDVSGIGDKKFEGLKNSVTVK